MADLPDSGEDVRGIVRGAGFVLIAIGAVLSAWSYLAESVRSPQGKYLVGGALMIAGAIVLADGMKWVRGTRVRNSLRDEHPREPWLWRSDWAAGYAAEETKSSNAAWIVAAGLLVLLLPFAPQIVASNPDPILLLLAAVAAAAAVWAAVRFVRQRKQAGSLCRLDAVPVAPGNAARGVVETPVDSIAGPVAVKLESITRRQMSPNSHAGITVILWQAETTVERESLGRSATGITVPFSIAIPAGVPNTHVAAEDAIEWRLTLKAPTEGIDYEATFEIPVFDAVTATRELDAETATDARAALDAQLEKLKKMANERAGH